MGLFKEVLRNWLMDEEAIKMSKVPRYAKLPANDELFSLFIEAMHKSFSDAKQSLSSDRHAYFEFISIPNNIFDKQQYQELKQLRDFQERQLNEIALRVRCLQVLTGTEPKPDDLVGANSACNTTYVPQPSYGNINR